MRSRSGTAVPRASAAASMMSLRLHTKVEGAMTLGALASVTHPRITMSLSSALALAAAPNPTVARTAADRVILSVVICTPPEVRQCNMRARPAGTAEFEERIWPKTGVAATSRTHLRDNRGSAGRGVAQPGRALALGARS